MIGLERYAQTQPVAGRLKGWGSKWLGNRAPMPPPPPHGRHPKAARRLIAPRLRQQHGSRRAPLGAAEGPRRQPARAAMRKAAKGGAIVHEDDEALRQWISKRRRVTEMAPAQRQAGAPSYREFQRSSPKCVAWWHKEKCCRDAAQRCPMGQPQLKDKRHSKPKPP